MRPIDPPTPWHRLFGMALTDLFAGRPWRVELELELALKSQWLDVLIIERLAGQAARADLPDGLDNLRAHNVLTYKSAQESLDAWAIDELIGHYVNYRKLDSRRAASTPAAPEPDGDGAAPPAGPRRLPASTFGLYAVATRHPGRLLGQVDARAWRPTAWPGVYDLIWGHRPIRLIVLNAIAAHPRNAPWELFASEMARFRDGLAHYPPHSVAARLLRYHLARAHQLELADMAYTLDDFKHDTWRLLLDEVPRLSAEERAALLERIDAEERLRGLGPEERLRGLGPEERLRGLGPEERLRGLGPEELRQLLDYLKTLH